MPLDLSIVVPSRKRVGNMPTILKLLPTALIYVDEREEKDYLKVVPKERLVTHPPNQTFCELRRMMWREERFGEVLCTCDDDLVWVRSMVGRYLKKITCGHAITQIITNTAQVAKDLDARLFGFNVAAHPGMFWANDPFTFSGLTAGCWGQVGRDILPDPRLITTDDVDMTLQCLRDHRIVFQDRRFFFGMGAMGEGEGGCQAVRTSQSDEYDKDLLLKKWSPHLDLGERNSFGQKSGGGRKLSIKVQRKGAMVDLK